MSDTSSLRFTVIETEASRAMNDPIALDMHRLVVAMAGPRRPAESVKAYLRRMHEAMGRPPFWRVRAAFYHEAGPWSAAAVRDFQARYQAFMARGEQRAAHERAVEAAIGRKTAEPEFVTLARSDYHDLVERISALEAALRVRT